MGKATKRLITLFLSIPFFVSQVFTMADQTEWEKIEGYKTGIEVREGVLEIFPQRKELIPKEIKELFNSEYIKEYFCVEESDYIKLVKFFKKKKWLDSYIIKRIILANFIKNHHIFGLEPFRHYELYDYHSVFVVEKYGGIYKFEKTEKDIKFFNKMIREEKIKVLNPSLALDICMLYIKMSSHPDESLIEDFVSIEDLFEKLYGKMKKEMLNMLKHPLHGPLYIHLSNKYQVKFFTSPTMIGWHFEVNKNGEIRLINMFNVY